MEFIETALKDVLILEPRVFSDERGFFMESWNKKIFSDVGIQGEFVQDNHSRSQKNTLRGLHYQSPMAQGKLVRVSKGEVFDVAVDLREDSQTFGQWTGVYLSEENKRMLWIPAGFAHGFLVTSELADFQYKCTEFYAPEHEHTILWNDKDLNIEWPIGKNVEPIVSPRDQQGVAFKDARY